LKIEGDGKRMVMMMMLNEDDDDDDDDGQLLESEYGVR
jgi:hypothetical protein